MRWSIFLENYDYEIVHRSNNQMQHVDALSRANTILVLNECSLSQRLAIHQTNDTVIKELREELSKNGDLTLFTLKDGLVYRKSNDKLLFYVPQKLENEIIRKYHEIGHGGVSKTCELMKRCYYFPNMMEKCNDFIKSCLQCLVYEPKNGKKEGFLNLYEKYDVPFHTIHVDHLGPFAESKRHHKYILMIVDGFTKFMRIFATKTTNSREVINKLQIYFKQLSTPKRIVTDRGTSLRSKELEEFLKTLNIQHVCTAAYSPQSNGQAERYNRSITPIIAKLTENSKHHQWDLVLTDTEFVVNNTLNRTIKVTPAIALFGVNQRQINDDLEEFVHSKNENQTERDLNSLRDEIKRNIVDSQFKNKEYFDKKRILAKKYKIGDFVLIKNVVTEPGINHKLLPKYKGPFLVTQILPGDRYVIENIPASPMSRQGFKSVYAAFNMKHYDHEQSESIVASGEAEL